MSKKVCERCNGEALSGERFCKDCRKAVLDEMKNAGYLQRFSNFHRGGSRTGEMRESVYETKYGN